MCRGHNFQSWGRRTFGGSPCPSCPVSVLSPARSSSHFPLPILSAISIMFISLILFPIFNLSCLFFYFTFYCSCLCLCFICLFIYLFTPFLQCLSGASFCLWSSIFFSRSFSVHYFRFLFALFVLSFLLSLSLSLIILSLSLPFNH